MARIEFDDHELREFAAELDAAGQATQREIRAVVVKGAVNIKNQLRTEMQASTHFRPVARAIDFDVREVNAFGGGIIEAEIGPVRGSPGSLANIAYFGASRGGGGTVPDPEDALMAEVPKFEDALGNLIEDML